MGFWFWIAVLALLSFVGVRLYARSQLKQARRGGGVPEDEAANDSVAYTVQRWSWVLFAVFLLGMFLSSFKIVSPGNAGIPVTFGSAGEAHGSGIMIKWPWTSVETISVRTEEYTMARQQGEGQRHGDDSVSVVTKDQVTVRVDATVFYNIAGSDARGVFVTLGKDYVEKLVRPSIREAIRTVGGRYEATELATTAREKYATEIIQQLEPDLGTYGVTLVDVKIRDTELPRTIRNAVNAKIRAKQLADQQQFELQRVQQQAEQRRVEAQGLADAQAIIRLTLSPEYLSYEYIKTLEALVGSPNTTFLFVPNDPSGLPSFVLPPGSQSNR